MKNKTLLSFLLMAVVLAIVLLPSVYAYDPHKQNNDLEFSFTSNNATSCNVTNVILPNKTSVLINQRLTKFSQTFTMFISKSNFTLLGDYCFNLECIDNSNAVESGSKCFEVTPSGRNDNSNIYFMIFIIVMIYTITFVGFFGKNEIITILGGMCMMALSIYLINNGLIIYRDWLTNYFAYLTAGLGFILSLIASFSLYQDM